MLSKTVYSTQTTIDQAIAELKEGLSGFDAAFVLYFASPQYDPEALPQAMQLAFDNAVTAGCTTSGEITSGKMLSNSIVAMAYSQEAFQDFKIEIIENLRGDYISGVKQAFTNFETHFGQSAELWDHNDYFGLLFIDGLSMTEEKVNDQIGNLCSVMFVGGSAGDEMAFKQTHVYANGKRYSNAAMLILVKSTANFSILKTQSFKSTAKKLTVTKADSDARIVYEFNHQPATTAYAQALGVPEEKLEEHFHSKPLGLVLNEDNIFVRSPRIREGEHIHFYCAMEEGMELEVLESLDIVEETRKALAKKNKELGGASSILNFNCVLRAVELKKKEQEEDYGQLFADTPTAGFNTYGESYIGHINQTATMLFLK